MWRVEIVFVYQNRVSANFRQTKCPLCVKYSTKPHKARVGEKYKEGGGGGGEGEEERKDKREEEKSHFCRDFR